MSSKLLSRRDVEFMLYEWLGAAGLCARERFADHSRETFDAALDASERVAQDHFAPINRLLDDEEPQFDGERVTTPAALKVALKAFSDAGMIAAGFDADHGGMQLPYVVERVCFAYYEAASIGAAAYPMLTMANANLLLAHGTPQQIETWVPPMLEGRFMGTMNLSEPQAGSSLSDIRTRAVRQPDGTYRIFGNKMWISGGDQDLSENIVHLVLAKIQDESGQLIPGVKGISLFIVPKILLNADGTPGERNDVVLAGLNHKMGYRGTVNTLMNYGEGRFQPGGAPGAIGDLIGREHQGLSCMFHMMNEARIGVGIGAAALGYTAYLHALEYARTRPQGRGPQDKNPAAPQVRIIEHADVRRMLLAQKAYAEGGLALNLYCARLVDDKSTSTDPAEREHAHQLLELLTPIAKSWPSQWCQEGNSLAIQVLGGYGYTRDYPVEQFYRDQRLNPIHEGTHGIQGIDLLGRKVRMDAGRAFTLLRQEFTRTGERCRAAGGEWAVAAAALEAVGMRLYATQAALHALGHLERTLANASVYLEAFGHAVVAWIWLEQAMCAHAALTAGGAGLHDDECAFYSGKMQAARFFIRWELPRVGPMLDLLDSADDTTLQMRDEWF